MTSWVSISFGVFTMTSLTTGRGEALRLVEGLSEIGSLWN